MTNEEIIKWLEARKKQRLIEHSMQEPEELWRRGELQIIGTILPLLKAQQDECEKMQGVEVWVSWDKHHKWEEVARISTTEPVVEAEGMDGAVIYKTVEPYSYVSKVICKLLNISPGQCKKFRIVEKI